MITEKFFLLLIALGALMTIAGMGIGCFLLWSGGI